METELHRLADLFREGFSADVSREAERRRFSPSVLAIGAGKSTEKHLHAHPTGSG